jgi:hypothetical protein
MAIQNGTGLMNPDPKNPSNSPASNYTDYATGKITVGLQSLIKACAEIDEQAIPKNNKNQWGSTYSDLPSLMKVAEPSLKRNGLKSFFYETTTDDLRKSGWLKMDLRIIHQTTGQIVYEGSVCEPLDLKKSLSPTPQVCKSTRTYARKQLYQMALGITERDDDADSTSNVAEVLHALIVRCEDPKNRRHKVEEKRYKTIQWHGKQFNTFKIVSAINPILAELQDIASEHSDSADEVKKQRGITDE